MEQKKFCTYTKSAKDDFKKFSNTTVTHFACYNAGQTSFYGTSLLVGFTENGVIHQYQIDNIK
ncbi:hypothetical protein HW49_05515 [Porphyromonadaceae bacterium COT-184 OH4590]|nr:hypothetical protein HW49_05515 [Porphyromonadaceae bacterium COT-184 OH4590]